MSCNLWMIFTLNPCDSGIWSREVWSVPIKHRPEHFLFRFCWYLIFPLSINQSINTTHLLTNIIFTFPVMCSSFPRRTSDTPVDPVDFFIQSWNIWHEYSADICQNNIGVCLLSLRFLPYVPLVSQSLTKVVREAVVPGPGDSHLLWKVRRGLTGHLHYYPFRHNIHQ